VQGDGRGTPKLDSRGVSSAETARSSRWAREVAARWIAIENAPKLAHYCPAGCIVKHACAAPRRRALRV